MNDIDRQIKELISNDDPAALEMIYDRYSRLLYSLFLNRSHDRELSADLLQQLFMRLAKNNKALLKAANLQAYLCRMAVNLHLDELRKKQFNHEQYRIHLDPAPASPDKLIGRLKALLPALPGDQQEVLHLKINGELTFREIAETLGLSPNTVASRYRYAVDKLKSMLKEEAHL